MINLAILKNPFKPHQREIKPIACTGQSVFSYISDLGMKVEDLVVCHNGRTIEPAEYKTIIPAKGDFIGVCPVIGGGGGGKKNILAIVASIALMFVAGGVGAQVTARLGGAAVKSAVMAGKLATMAVMAIGGMVINHLFPPPKLENQQDSPTYSWGKMTAMQGQGNPVALTYGTVRTAGQIVAYDMESDGDKQYLKILLCGGEGQIDEISDILINDNPLTSYKDVIVETRLGTNDQTVIQNFNDTFASQDVSVELLVDNTWTTRITDGNGGEGLRITLEFPYGLYYINSEGKKQKATVKVKAQYRKEGDVIWTDWSEWEISEAKNSGAYRKMYRVDNLPVGRYEVRCQCTYKSGDNPQSYATRVYWTELSHIIYDDFCRPGKVLVGIKALATDQLSGGVPNISWLQKRNTVYVWDANTLQYVMKPATNPAWACYDLIHRAKLLRNIQTGLDEFAVFGVPAARMDYQAFLEWAQFCDYIIDDTTGEKRCTVNIIIDSISDLWGALRNIEICGRGKVVLKGTRFSAVCDKPADPVMLFTMGNIVPDTFQEEFLPLKDRANAIEITFFNKEKGYQRDLLTVYADDYDAVETVPVVTQITLPGVTTVSEAYRVGKYRLKLNKYLIRTCSWEADIDALACQVGDVVNFAHDVPEWGQSGRLTAATNESLTLDREVQMVSGKSYSVAVRLSDDTMLENAVTNTAGMFSRSSVAYKSDGSQIASGLPRYEDGVVLVEEGTVNLLPAGSENFVTGWSGYSGAAVTITPGQPDPFGGNTAYRIQASGGTSSLKVLCSVYNLPNPHTLTGSVWAKLNGASACKISVAGGSTAPSITNQFSRLSSTVTGRGSASNYLSFYANSIAESIDIIVFFPQAENKPYPTSYIPPGQTRSPEVLTVPTAGNANEIAIKLSRPPGTNQQYIFDSNGAANQSVRVYIRTDGKPEMVYGTGSAEVTITGTNALVKDTDYSVGFAADSDGGRLLVNGVQVASNTTAADIAFGASVYWGSKADGTLQLDGIIKDLRCSNTRFNAEILADYTNYTAQGKSLPVDERTTAKYDFEQNLNAISQTVKVATPYGTPPQADDLYSFGETNIVTKPFRLLYLTRSGDMRRKLTAIEYIPEVYTEADNIPVINYSGAANVVTNVSASGRVDGAGDLWIDISWIPSRMYNGARVLIDGVKAGEVSADKSVLSVPVILFKTYAISVIALDIFGNAGTATTISYDFSDPGSGTGPPPPDVQYFGVSVLAAQVLFSIKMASTDFANTNIVGIEFRKGDSWESGQLVCRITAGSDEATAPAYKGTHRYWAAAYNHYAYSENPITDVITIDVMPEKEKVLEYYSYDDAGRTITGDYSAVGSFTVQKTALTYASISTMPWSTLKTTRLLSPAVGTYTVTGDVIDIGKVAQVLISPEETWFVTPDAPSLYEIQTSINNVNWSEWKLLTSGLISTRYMKIRFTVRGVSRCGILKDVKIVVSAKTQTLKIEDVTVPLGGVVVPMNPSFIYKPAYVVTPSNNAHIVKKTLETNSELKIQLYDVTGAEVSGTADIVAVGF